MKYLVTGGAGFIGSHLVDRLLNDEHEVVVIDDFSEGKIENLPMKNPKLTIYYKSILDENHELFKGVDIVFHLAALTRPQGSIKFPKEYNRVNIEGTLNILIAAKDNEVKRVVFASSSSVYGDQKTFPTSEDAEPNPISPYASQKLMGELYCDLFGKIYGLEVNCIRPFNVYGKRMNPDSTYAALIPGFIKKFRSGVRPTINGDGEQVRDFTYIDDVVEVFIRASESKVAGEIFNAGSGINTSVNDVSNLIRKTLKTDIEPIHGPTVIEPRTTLADMGKVKKLLKYKPKVSLKEGLERMINGA